MALLVSSFVDCFFSEGFESSAKSAQFAFPEYVSSSALSDNSADYAVSVPLKLTKHTVSTVSGLSATSTKRTSFPVSGTSSQKIYSTAGKRTYTNVGSSGVQVSSSSSNRLHSTTSMSGYPTSRLLASASIYQVATNNSINDDAIGRNIMRSAPRRSSPGSGAWEGLDCGCDDSCGCKVEVEDDDGNIISICQHDNCGNNCGCPIGEAIIPLLLFLAGYFVSIIRRQRLKVNSTSF